MAANNAEALITPIRCKQDISCWCSELHRNKADMSSLASFCYGKGIILVMVVMVVMVVILVTSHKGRDMLGRDKLGIMA
jgi:hypothetical protein